MPLVEYYKEQYRAYGHDPKKIQTGVYSNTFITDSKDEILEYFYPEYAARMDKIGTERGWRRSFTKGRFLAATRPEGVLFMGNWEEVAEKSFNWLTCLSVPGLLLIWLKGHSHKELMKAIELYGTKVIPVVKKHFRQ